MPILTPTKDDGSTAKASDVVYVEPERTVSDADLAEALTIEGANAGFIADFLSACVTHERCGTHLYRSVAERTNNAVLKAKYEEFGDETLRHVGILEELIASTGGNPAYVSPLARAVEAADTKALESTFLTAGGLDPMSMEMSMLDAVYKAEVIDHSNWEALSQLADMLPKGAARKAMQSAVEQVEPDEDDHLSWARETRARLTMLQASSSVLAKAGAKAEELMAEVKGWLSGTGTGKGATAPAKKAPTKKGSASAMPAKKAASKKASAASKTASKKAMVDKAVAASVPANKAAAKKRGKKEAPTSSASAKKAAAKKSAKKVASKSAPAKKSAAKKSAAKKTTAKKAPAKKSVTKKAPAKKSAAKKAPAKKAPAKKSAAKKAPAKKSTGRTAKR